MLANVKSRLLDALNVSAAELASRLMVCATKKLVFFTSAYKISQI
jgi:hypothetical protein